MVRSGLPPVTRRTVEIRDSSAVTEGHHQCGKNGQFSSSSVIVGIAGLRRSPRIDLRSCPTVRSTVAVAGFRPRRSSLSAGQTSVSGNSCRTTTRPRGEQRCGGSRSCRPRRSCNGVIQAWRKGGLTVDGVDLNSRRHFGGRAIAARRPGKHPTIVWSDQGHEWSCTTGRPSSCALSALAARHYRLASRRHLDLPLATAEGVKRR